MTAVDSSVAIAALSPWHVSHRAALGVLRGAPMIPGHALTEAYSVLTRMPPPRRTEPGTAMAGLRKAFRRVMVLSARDHVAALARLAESRVGGGAVYDGLIAMTAAHAGATLVTLDRRAAPVYVACGVAVEVIDSG